MTASFFLCHNSLLSHKKIAIENERLSMLY
nr:MAG TPA: hypothetical protein [Caudoviricetes sp.]